MWLLVTYSAYMWNISSVLRCGLFLWCLIKFVKHNGDVTLKNYLDVSKYVPCTLDYPSKWWGVEVHGKVTDTDNPKSLLRLATNKKVKLDFGYYINDTHTSYVSSLCFCSENFVHSVLRHAISHRH